MIAKPALATTLATTLAAGLLAAGCGASASNHFAGMPSLAQARHSTLKFAQCMRTHGVPEYPDPQVSSSGGQVHVRISPGNANPNSPAFHGATRVCGPPGGGQATIAGGNLAALKSQGVRYAACMRSHGVPGFPDPDHHGGFNLPAGVDSTAPAFQTAGKACAKVAPSSLQINDAPPS